MTTQGEAMTHEDWTPEMLNRLYRMVVGPVRCRRERARQQRRWLEENEPPSRLDIEERKRIEEPE